jgi:hypothetical protein
MSGQAGNNRRNNALEWLPPLVYCLRNDFTHLVIPDLIKPAPYLIRGNPAFSIWIPAGVYPVLDTGRE